ncbi:MAG: YdiU family protein [Kofleriaceae bacterium]
MAHVQLAELQWEDLFVRTFPGDDSGRVASRQLPGACYARVAPTPVAAPRLLAWSREAGELLRLAPPTADDAAVAAEIFSGNRPLPGMKPYAAAYGGHQFGTWAGQLGDGRAITLGEVVGAKDARWELQLKGAGPTPYSRRSDGRAVLRSSIREFLCSEAMAHLGVPTTRALCLVATGEPVTRDMFYDGRPRDEPGAIVCRVAPSFARFGTFELLAFRQELAELRRLAAYVIAGHFPELDGAGALGAGDALDAAALTPGLVARWYAEVCRRTAVLLAHWMRVGFVHGVMNTDNMSILGLTLDYGPYGWLDSFDPDFTPNTSDAATGRYRFGMQPGIAQWNLAHLARALTSLCGERAEQEALALGLDLYRTTFEQSYGGMMLAKLGLAAGEPGEDERLINDLLALLPQHETDPTWFYRRLAALPGWPAEGPARAALLETLAPAWSAPPPAAHADRVLAWLARYLPRRDRQPGGAAEAARRMRAANPIFLLRNYLVQQAIVRAERALTDPAGDPRDATDAIAALLAAARAPYVEGPEHAGLLERRPDWARDAPGCGALSCSS